MRKQAGYMRMSPKPNYANPPLTKEYVERSAREDGRLDALDATYGEEPTREYPAVRTNKRLRRDYAGYTPELLEIARAAYREGYDRYMTEYGDDVA